MKTSIQRHCSYHSFTGTDVASNVKAPDYHVLARTIWCLSSECSLPLEGASQDGSITSTGSPSLGSRTTPAESSTRDTRHNITTTSVQVTTDSASITPSATSSSSGFTTAINPSSPSQPFTARTSRTTSWSPDLRPTESILSSSSPIHSISATPISSSPIHIPAIVGGVVGVAVLMTIFVTWLLCCRRRRRQATNGKGREFRTVVLHSWGCSLTACASRGRHSSIHGLRKTNISLRIVRTAKSRQGRLPPHCRAHIVRGRSGWEQQFYCW